MNEKYRKIAYIAIPLLIIVILLGTLYQNGYRITSNFKIVKTGTLKLNTSVDNPTVFINSTERDIKIALDGSYLVEKITPGSTSILVTKEGYWPWKKDITIDEERITETDPFLTPRNTIKRIILKETPEFKEISKILSTTTNPSDKNKLKSKSGNVAVWVEGTVIKAEWLGAGNPPYYFCQSIINSSNKDCPKTTDVVTLLKAPQGVIFKADSDYILLFRNNDSMYAIEIHRYGLQNFHPVYTGINPVMNYVSGILYLRDGNIMAEISL